MHMTFIYRPKNDGDNHTDNPRLYPSQEKIRLALLSQMTFAIALYSRLIYNSLPSLHLVYGDIMTPLGTPSRAAPITHQSLRNHWPA